MDYRKVTAFVPHLDLERVEKALLEVGIPGMTVSKSHGFGEYRNYYANDLMHDCVRVEVFIEGEKADDVVDKIARTVHSGVHGDGMIAVMPASRLLQIRDFVVAGQTE